MKHPARLFVILAREAPLAVIVRRGPSRWVQLILWHTDSDTFEPGQWFHGRIYERRCDLSPDGTRFVYFVNKINSHTLRDKAYTYAWSAVSTPPYLTTLALWPKGDCWHGGGLFEDNRTLLLNHAPFQATPHPRHLPPKQLRVMPNPLARGEDSPIYHRRLKRDGWIMEQDSLWTRPQDGNTLHMEQGWWDFQAYGGPYVMQYAVDNGQHMLLIKGRVTWADWDQQGRLVYARDGKLFSAEIGQHRLDEREIADFNAHKPQQVVTPKWARRW